MMKARYDPQNMLTPKTARLSTADIVKLLQRATLFGAIETKHLERLAANASIKEYKVDQPIWPADAFPDALYVVSSGLVKRILLSSASNERVLDLLQAGDCVGLPELLAKRSFGALALAARPSRLVCLNGAMVREIIDHVPALAQRVYAMLALRQLELESELSSKQSLATSERVLGYLVRGAAQPLSAKGETPVHLPASKKLIASLLGITPETLSRALRELADAGLIEIRGRLIALKNGPIGMRSRAPLEPMANPATEPTSLYSVINIAGRQRMLSQRMAKFWMLLAYEGAPSNAKKILQQSMANFDKQRRQLDSLQLPAELRSIQQQVDRLWLPYRTMLEHSTTLADAPAVLNLSEEILELTDQAALGFSRMTVNDGGSLVNLAARQRMLVHRIAKCYLFSDCGVGVDQCSAISRAASADFCAALVSLSEEAIGEPQIESGLNRISKQWMAMQTTLEAGVREDSARRAVNVSDLSERLVRQVDSVVFLFERLAESR